MNTIETKFKMGDVLKDKVTGFIGVVLCISRYSTGCTHYSIQAQKVGKDGKVADWETFDETRLVKTKQKSLSFDQPEQDKLKAKPKRSVGGPAPAPSRHVVRK